MHSKMAPSHMENMVRFILVFAVSVGCSTPSDPDGRRRRLADRPPLELPAVPSQHAYWDKMVPEALRGGAPRAGNSTLLFVHIPKTAGSSMERVLEKVACAPLPSPPRPSPLRSVTRNVPPNVPLRDGCALAFCTCTGRAVWLVSFFTRSSQIVDSRPPVCMRRFMASDPEVDESTGLYPTHLLQHYPENKECENRRGVSVF